jgi:hypothetical protein
MDEARREGVRLVHQPDVAMTAEQRAQAIAALGALFKHGQTSRDRRPGPTKKTVQSAPEGDLPSIVAGALLAQPRPGRHLARRH